MKLPSLMIDPFPFVKPLFVVAVVHVTLRKACLLIFFSSSTTVISLHVYLIYIFGVMIFYGFFLSDIFPLWSCGGCLHHA